MQPYFVPYLGYFRLFITADIFVVLDSVQFPSAGYVHRNRLPNHLARPQWLKLPLARAPLRTLIRDLAFRPDARTYLETQFTRFPALQAPRPEAKELMRLMLQFEMAPVEYLMSTMQLVCEMLRAPWRVVRSSDMPIPAELRGQERVIEIVRLLGGTVYVNAPGGRLLYDPKAFEHAGITLRFLTNYSGSPWSVLWRLAVEDSAKLRTELVEGSVATA